MSAQTNGTVTTPLPPRPVADEPVTTPSGTPAESLAVDNPAGDIQEQARQAYRQSLADEKPLSGKALGAMFERGERWGRDRIGEVKNGTDTPVRKATPPASRPATKPTAKPSAAAAQPVERKPTTTPTSAPRGTQSTATNAEPAPGPTGGRLVSWVGFVFGSVMSVAANVLHTWLPAAVMPPGWTPGIASQVGAAVWPIGLLLSVEVLSRVKWQPGVWWSLARYGGAGTVALGAAVISYGHLRDVLTAWGYGPLAAHVGPLVLDGLMVIAGFALLAMSSQHGGKKGAAA
jgi:hypothetical protein